MSSAPVGTSSPVISLSARARRLAIGTPRVRTPTSARSSTPLLRSTISWAMRVRVRPMRSASMTTGMCTSLRPRRTAVKERSPLYTRVNARRRRGTGHQQHAPLLRLQRHRARRSRNRRATRAPGQFVMVKPGRGTDPLLRRPFSVFEVLREQRHVSPASRCSASASASPRDCSSTPSKATWSRASGRWAGRSSSSTRRRRPGWWRAASAWRRLPRWPKRWSRAACATTLFYGARSGQELFYLDWFASRGVDAEARHRGRHPRRQGARHAAARARAARRTARPT